MDSLSDAMIWRATFLETSLRCRMQHPPPRFPHQSSTCTVSSASIWSQSIHYYRVSGPGPQLWIYGLVLFDAGWLNMVSEIHTFSVSIDDILLTESKMAEDLKEKLANYRTAPFDARFPNQNQTRNCWSNYLGKTSRSEQLAGFPGSSHLSK